MQTVNVRMWKQSNNGNDRLREQTSKSSCQATAATKTTIATMMGICICARIIFWHIDFPQKCKQSMCVCGSKETMETTDSDNKQQNRHARRRRR